MSKRSIRKDDLVLVLSGKERGKQGKVIKIFTDRGRVLVEKVNMVKRHVRPSRKQPHGGIVEKEASLALSNLILVCPSCNQPIRVKKRFLEDGRKARSCPKCEEILDR